MTDRRNFLKTSSLAFASLSLPIFTNKDELNINNIPEYILKHFNNDKFFPLEEQIEHGKKFHIQFDIKKIRKELEQKSWIRNHCLRGTMKDWNNVQSPERWGLFPSCLLSDNSLNSQILNDGIVESFLKSENNHRTKEKEQQLIIKTDLSFLPCFSKTRAGWVFFEEIGFC